MTNQKPRISIPEMLAAGTALVVVLAVLASPFYVYPTWRVWQQGMSGKAKLREAEWSRKILIEEADAMRQSEISRAEGVAEANRIIGESLQGNQEYLTYLWLQHLSHDNNKIIYIPTEGNLPLLEAGRFRN